MNFGKTIAAAVAIGVFCGLASSFFLVALEAVTFLFQARPSLIVFLPLGGFAVGLLYLRFGSTVERGTSLILDEIHEPRKWVPFRLAPLVLLGTLVTHIFGGSAGREGTAVQMGGAIADGVAKLLQVEGKRRSTLLLAGLAGGFASVFGTPWAGAVFGLEILSFRNLRDSERGLERLTACGVSAFIGHLTVLLCGIHHTRYVATQSIQLTLKGFITAALAGAAFGLMGWCFVRATHKLGHWFQRIKFAPFRPLIGGVAVAILVWHFHLTRFTGLGLSAIVDALGGQGSVFDFAWKFLLTVLTLGSGFKGGEVTPLFFIGATFGKTLGLFLPLSPTLLAAMGFVAVFGGAANVPLTATLLAAELFGINGLPYFAVACAFSFLLSGRTGIYSSSLNARHFKHKGSP